MKANGGGRIIHILSQQHGIVAGRERVLGVAPLKAALAFLARGMAYEASRLLTS